LATYEDSGGREPETEPAEDYDPQALAENIEALRALGYVQADAEESSPEIHNNLGGAHLRRGEFDEARTEFRKALALDPNNADARLETKRLGWPTCGSVATRMRTGPSC
jgi:tetratricopeptide (TPR) repeat protein